MVRKKGTSIVRLGLVLAMMLSVMSGFALANESTTTIKTVYKDLSPRTEIYAVTDAPGQDYVYYGAKWEPKGGVLYGRTAQGGTLSSGGYGLVNADALANESVISFYYSLSDSYSLEYWSYLYGKVLADGTHAFLVYLNFDNEGADCTRVVGGEYDAKLTEAFRYLSTLSCPVFVRIGGEMNVWSNAAAPAQFIEAYQHIAKLARAHSPNAALVFSPNYSGAANVDMDSFYPGDSYVDWIGTSLYYNHYANNGDTRWPEFYGVGVYGDAMLNVQQTVNLANLHSKPIILTEGGSSNKFDGVDDSAWAAERMQKAYSFLTMVYPQIKCVVSSDYGMAWERTSYTFYNNSVVTAAYDKAVAGNPTFVHSCQDAGSYYTKLSAYRTDWTGTVQLAAYTYAPDKLSATWYVDDSAIATAADYPYSCTLNTNTLSSGTHTLKVAFSNGASKSYQFKVNMNTANPSNDKLYMDGQLQNACVYKIDGSNYFMLREIAALLNGTKRQFEVGYDAQRACVTITTGRPYTADGSELVGQAGGGGVNAVPSNNDVYIDGRKVDLTVYKINDRNYFKLRDLGEALNFYVGYDPAAGVTISGGQDFSM